MARGFFSSAKQYAQNAVGHVRQVIAREETLVEALTDITKEPPKPASEPVDLSSPKIRAAQLVRAGRHKYQARDYETAERCFRSAMLEDPRCVAAIAYLGHALHRQGNTDEAVLCWKRAFSMDPNSEPGLKAYQKLKQVEPQACELIGAMPEQG